MGSLRVCSYDQSRQFSAKAFGHLGPGFYADPSGINDSRKGLEGLWGSARALRGSHQLLGASSSGPWGQREAVGKSVLRYRVLPGWGVGVEGQSVRFFLLVVGIESRIRIWSPLVRRDKERRVCQERRQRSRPRAGCPTYAVFLSLSCCWTSAPCGPPPSRPPAALATALPCSVAALAWPAAHSSGRPDVLVAWWRRGATLWRRLHEGRRPAGVRQFV